MINIILEGYYTPAISLKKHLTREMNKSELTKIEYFDSLLFAIGNVKKKIEEHYYRALPHNDNLDLLKQGIPLLHINSNYIGHIKYADVLEIIELIEAIKKYEILKDNLNEVKNKTKKRVVNHKAEALKMYYEGKIVTKKEHGTSLYNKFIHYSSRQNRIANPDGTDLVLTNKIKLFKQVIEMLEDKYKAKAQDEVKILESYLVAK